MHSGPGWIEMHLMHKASIKMHQLGKLCIVVQDGNASNAKDR